MPFNFSVWVGHRPTPLQGNEGGYICPILSTHLTQCGKSPPSIPPQCFGEGNRRWGGVKKYPQNAILRKVSY